MAAHDLARGEHAPEVGGRVVAQPVQEAVGALVRVRRGVEVDLRPARVVLAVALQRGLQVPDPHVVRDHRQLLVAEALLGDLQVAPGPGQGGGGVEALVGPAALGAQAGGALAASTALGAGDRGGEPLAAGHVDLHAEQVGRRAGEDLGEAHGALEVVACPGVRAAAALEEHHGLEQVGAHAGLGGNPLDLLAQAGHPAGAGAHAVGALLVQHGRVAARGARHVLVLALGVPAQQLHAAGGLVVAGQGEQRQDAGRGQRSEQHEGEGASHARKGGRRP